MCVTQTKQAENHENKTKKRRTACIRAHTDHILGNRHPHLAVYPIVIISHGRSFNWTVRAVEFSRAATGDRRGCDTGTAEGGRRNRKEAPPHNIIMYICGRLHALGAPFITDSLLLLLRTYVDRYVLYFKVLFRRHDVCFGNWWKWIWNVVFVRRFDNSLTELVVVVVINVKF